MNRSQTALIPRLLAAMVLAFIGHWFVAFRRDTYPLDGYVFYIASAFFFVWTLQSARNLPGGDLSELGHSLRLISNELRRIFSILGEVRLGARLLVGLIVVNLISAVLALLFESGLALIGWIASAIWLGLAIWPRAPETADVDTVPVPETELFIESEDAVSLRSRPALLIAGLLAVLFGQMLMALELESEGALGLFGFIGDITNSLAESLRLQIVNPAIALIGLAALGVGAALFAVATRRVVLADRPRLQVEVHAGRVSRSSGSVLLALIGFAMWFLTIRLVADGATGLGPVLLWVGSLVLIGIVWRQIDHDLGVRWNFHLPRYEVYSLAAIMVVTLVVWLFQLDRLPASIWGDEGAYWSTARDIASGAAPMNAFGLGTYSFPAGGTVYQSIVISLFGPTVWAWRLGSVLAVVAAMLPLYLLVRELLGRRIAVASLVFYATSPLLLAYGRLGYLYALVILPVLLSVMLIVRAIRHDSRLLAFLAGVASGVGFMIYPSAWFGLVMCALVLISFAVTRMMRGLSLLRLGTTFLAALILAAGPFLTHGLVREPEAFLDKIVENSMANVLFAQNVFGREEILARATLTSTRDNDLFFEPSMYTTLALRGWLRTAIAFNRGGFVGEHYVVGALAGPLTLLYVIGLGWCLTRLKRPGYALWPIWLFAGTFLLSAIETFPPHATDLLPVMPALAVTAAIGAVSLIDILRGYWPSMSQRVETGLLTLVILVVGVLGLRTYFVEMPQRYVPSLEMSMFWSTFDLPRGSTIAFVRDESYPPEFKPWGMQNFETGVAWMSLDTELLPQSDLQPICSIDCLIFYTPAYADAVDVYLQNVFAAGETTTYRNAEGDVIGYAYAPGGTPD